MLSSAPTRCGRLAIQIRIRKHMRNGQNSSTRASRRYTTEHDANKPAETQDASQPSRRVNNIFDTLKGSYKKNPFVAGAPTSATTYAPNAASVTKDSLRNIQAEARGVGNSRRAAFQFANSFSGDVKQRNQSNPTPDIVPEFVQIINFGRDRQNADVLSVWRAISNARPGLLAPPKVLRAVLLAYMQNLPDWVEMARLFEDFLRQESKLSNDLAASAVRAFATAQKFEQAIKVYEQIESGELTPRFSKPHFEAMLYRNVVDSYGGLHRFDDVNRIIEICAKKLPKENLSSVISGAMNALIEAGKADEAMKLFNKAHQEFKITIDNLLSNSLRRARLPILQQRQNQSRSDEEMFGSFLSSNSAPEETISDAWKKLEEAQQSGSKVGFSGYLVLMRLLRAVPNHPLTGERAAKIYAEADKSSELVNDTTALTSLYLEILLERGDLSTFESLYAQEIASKTVHIQPSTFESIMNFFLMQKKDSARALNVWRDFVKNNGEFTPKNCTIAFDIYEASKLHDEAFELFDILKTAERGITVTRIAYERIMTIALSLNDVEKVKRIAEEAAWATYRGVLREDNRALSRAREFLRGHAHVELRADKLIEARRQAEQSGRLSCEPVLEFNDPAVDYASPSLKDPEAVLKKFVPRA